MITYQETNEQRPTPGGSPLHWTGGVAELVGLGGGAWRIRQGEEATAGKAGDGLATPTPSARCTPPPQQRTAPLLYNKMKKERLLPVGVASGYSRPTSGNALFDGPDMRPIQMVILCRTIYVGLGSLQPPIPFSSLPNCRDRPAEPSRGRGGGRDRCKV